VERVGPAVGRPVLHAKDDDLARRIACERHVLVCGVPALRPLREPGERWLKPCADVSLDIIGRAQERRHSPMLKR
jgi:hypothetical protein